MFTPEEMAQINRDAAQDGVLLQEGAGNGLSLTRPPTGSAGGISGYSYGRSQIDLGQGSIDELDAFRNFLNDNRRSVGLSQADVEGIMANISRTGRSAAVDRFTPQINRLLTHLIQRMPGIRWRM